MKHRTPIIAGSLIGIPAGVLLAANLAILFGASPDTTHDLKKLRPTPVALVLGCPPTVTSGQSNAFFESRMDAATTLYNSQKVKQLLLSGSATAHYNEPEAMKKALLQRGIPGEALILDTEGNRTIESVQRAINHFKLDEFVVVSQAFHTPRAVFLGIHYGAKVQGYNAPSIRGAKALRVRFREHLARLRVFVDLWVIER